MRRLSALLLLLPFGASAQVQSVTLDDVLRIVSEGPRVHASLRDGLTLIRRVDGASC